MHAVVAASVPQAELEDLGAIAKNPRWFSPPAYGLTDFRDLFTPRQALALTTFADLTKSIHDQVERDAAAQAESQPTAVDDSTPREYADAVATYLSLAVSRLADWSSNLCGWESSGEVSQHVFGQQSMNMTWDFSESNTLAEKSSGSFSACLKSVVRSLEQLKGEAPSKAVQSAAQTLSLSGMTINTDPPYYDNIGYSDLSDFFYVWLRRCLHDTYPQLFGTLLVPKAEELVANQYSHTSRDASFKHFEDGFFGLFHRASSEVDQRYPTVVYYAYKQGIAGSGWQSILEGIVRGGWQVGATWPIRSEGATRLVALDTNALASSIVLALRPRPKDAPSTDRRGFIRALQSELPDALRKLQQGAIAPVDLPQAAIGPGMSVFSRYSEVREPDGTPMTVKAALEKINETLDEVLNEQEGDFDATSRFALAWYRQNGYEPGAFGDADNLARARNTSVVTMDRDEILSSRAGKVQLLRPSALKPGYDVLADDHTSNWEALHYTLRALETDGIAPAGRFLAQALARPDEAVEADRVKELAHLLFRIADDNKWAKDALAFNSLVTAWPDILAASREVVVSPSAQGSFDFDEEED